MTEFHITRASSHTKSNLRFYQKWIAGLIHYHIPHQGRSQDFLKGGSSTSIELLEAGGWHSPQPLRNFQYFNKSKLSKLLYFMQKYINYDALSTPGMKVVLDKVT